MARAVLAKTKVTPQKAEAFREFAPESKVAAAQADLGELEILAREAMELA